MELGVGFFQEADDYVGALIFPVWMLGLKNEAGVFLVAFGGEADVVELNFIGAGLGYELGEGDVVVLNFPFSDLSQTKRRPALVLATIGE